MIERKHIFVGLALFILICVFYYLFIVFPRQDKVAVEILVNPSDASVYIDNEKSGAGKKYIHPGTHVFKAEKEGWTASGVTLDITDDTSIIALLPTPTSEDARLEAQKDAEKREELAGIAANTRGLDIRNTTPILNELPYSDTSGPYKIDYGFNQDDKRTPYLIVSYSTPNGRKEAIDWLIANEVDTTTLEIIFEDFINPIHKDKH